MSDCAHTPHFFYYKFPNKFMKNSIVVNSVELLENVVVCLMKRYRLSGFVLCESRSIQVEFSFS